MAGVSDDATTDTRPSERADPRDRLIDELSGLTLPLMWSLRQAATRAFEPLGFRPVKALVLGMIASGTRTPSELSELLDTTPPMMSSMLADLEERGLIARSTDPDDRRRVRVETTAAGRAMTARFRDVWNANARRQVRDLTDEDLRHLVRIYGTLAGPS